MNYLTIIALGFFALHTTAQATQLLAQKKISAFYPAADYNYSLSIFEDGTARLESDFIPTRTATLSADGVKKIQDEAAGLENIDLVDADAEAPYCADAPQISYSVFQARIKPEVLEIPLSLRSSCHLSMRPDSAGLTTEKILDQLALQMLEQAPLLIQTE